MPQNNTEKIIDKQRKEQYELGYKHGQEKTLAEVIGWTERLDADGCDFVSTEKIREYILSLKQKYE